MRMVIEQSHDLLTMAHVNAGTTFIVDCLPIGTTILQQHFNSIDEVQFDGNMKRSSLGGRFVDVKSFGFYKLCHGLQVAAISSDHQRKPPIRRAFIEVNLPPD